MTETLLLALQRQALLLSLGAVLLLGLRPLLLARFGARAAYAAWLLLPALLATPLLPRLGREPPLAFVAFGELALSIGAPLLPQADASWPRVVLTAWLGVAVVVIAWQAARQWRLSRRGTMLPAGASPALVGLWHPHVALPADFETRFAPQERRLILAHEQMHRARGDNAWNLLACLLTALHWWNPLAWLAARRMQADQELACDAAVLTAHPGSATTYTRALLAAHGLTPPRAPLASRWGTTHPLVERIAMLNRTNPWTRRRAAALVFSLLGVVGIAYAAQQTPPAQAADSALVRRVEIRLALSSDGLNASPRLITALGVPARIEWGPSPDKVWRLDFTITRADDGKLQVVTQPAYAGKALGRQTALLPSGQAFAHDIGGADGIPPLQMTSTVTMLPADFKLPVKPATNPPK